MTRFFLPTLLMLLPVLAAVLPVSAQDAFPKIDATQVTIVRDSFGIPHIFGKTDAEVAYGLAWANAEDAFDMIQNLLCATNGTMGRKDGIDGAAVDYFVHAIGARQLVNEHFDKDLSPEFKKYLDGYVQGINAYAAAHPKQVAVKRAFPVTAQDVEVAYVTIMSSLCRAQENIKDALKGNYDTVAVTYAEKGQLPVGSNAFALSNTKTTDGKTYLCINPHMQMEGQLSFYEAHLYSEEGLNMEGPMFQGSTSLAMGVNENLGWAMTWNHFDRVDVFRLKMNPKNKMEYEFDGKWEKLEKRPVWLKVALGKKKRLVLPVKKMAYWSKYGCTLKSGKQDNYYAVRFPGNMSILTGQQLYEMNKAKTYDQFWKALNYQSLALFNVIYADKENNIFYLHNGMLPDRKDQSFNWEGIVPGNTSRNLWTGFVPVNKLQQVHNPACGYVFNTNNTPYNATCADNNFKHGSLPDYADERPGNNMRAERAMEYFSKYDKFSFSDFKRMKFDVTLPQHSKLLDALAPLFNLDTAKYPDLKEAIQILKTWNRTCDIHEYGPTLLGLVINDLFKKKICSDDCFIMGVTTNEAELVSILRGACDTLRNNYGTVKVEWGTVNRSVRGSKDLPLRSFPDVLSPSYPSRMAGPAFKFKAKYGDTFIMFVAFDKNGVAKLEALQPQGNSLNPASPHYNDQMELFSRQEMRSATLKKEEVMKKAESVYHPQ